MQKSESFTPFYQTYAIRHTLFESDSDRHIVFKNLITCPLDLGHNENKLLYKSTLPKYEQKHLYQIISKTIWNQLKKHKKQNKKCTGLYTKNQQIQSL